MIKFSVLYPYKEGSWFDAKYYCNTHIAPYREDPLVKGIIVESGNSSRDFRRPPRYLCIAHFFYETPEDLYASRTPERTAAQMQDNINFTNVTAETLVSSLSYLNITNLTILEQE